MRLESKRASVPTLYLELGNKIATLLASPELEAKWNDPSALEGMSVGALAAHLGRAFTTTQLYILADPEPVDDEDADASAYFYNAFNRSDEDVAELNAGILQRAHDDAEVGVAGVRERHASTLADLKVKLIGEAEDRGIEVLEGMVMQLDDYLVTRMVEAVVHADDLAVSIGVDTPPFASDVVELVMVTLLGVARERHGDVAVLREFARGERAPGNLFPVF